MERGYNGSEESINILSRIDFSKICDFIKNFPKLNHFFVKEGVNLPLIYSFRVIKWQKQLMNYKHMGTKFI